MGKNTSQVSAKPSAMHLPAKWPGGYTLKQENATPRCLRADCWSFLYHLRGQFPNIMRAPTMTSRERKWKDREMNAKFQQIMNIFRRTGCLLMYIYIVFTLSYLSFLYLNKYSEKKKGGGRGVQSSHNDQNPYLSLSSHGIMPFDYCSISVICIKNK